MVHQDLDGSIGVAVNGGIHDRLVLIKLVKTRIRHTDRELPVALSATRR